MTIVYFITHPSVNIDKNTPIGNWSLSEKGIEEVRNLLKLDFWKTIKAVYTSTENKAIEVANLASKKYNLPVSIENHLTEINRDSTGFLEYPKYMETVEKFYKNPDQNIDGWESANEATNRIVSCISNIVYKNLDTNIAIIGHGATGTLLACYILGVKPTFKEDPNGTGRYMVIDWDKKKILQKWIQY